MAAMIGSAAALGRSEVSRQGINASSSSFSRSSKASSVQVLALLRNAAGAPANAELANWNAVTSFFLGTDSSRFRNSPSPVRLGLDGFASIYTRTQKSVSGTEAGRQKRFGIYALSTNDFRTGSNIELDGAPWRVMEFLHVKPGKGAAFVRTKLKNYVTGNTVERTFRAGENVDEASIQKDFKQYTYMDGEQYVFMDSETFEEVRLSESDIGDKTKFLMEGMECSVLSWNGRVIDIDLPVTVKLKVIQADPGVKGDTAQGGSKTVTVETGATVQVPLFVNQDDIIVIQTKDGTYISRG